MIKIYTVILVFLGAIGAYSDVSAQQQDSSSFSSQISADLVSRYNWRGINMGSSPCIQPTLAFSCKNFTLGSWASFSTAAEVKQELDLYASYSVGFVTFSLYDYFNPLETADSLKTDYFDYRSRSTLHTIEAMMETEPIKNFPLAVTVGVFVYGDDKKDSLRIKNNYSTYLQLAYPFTVNGNEVKLFCGASPSKGYYTQKFNVVNVGVSVSRSIEVTDRFSLPLCGTIGVNPELKSVYFVVGLSL